MGAENLSKIEHIVVLVQENRSFDHMLGYLSLPTRPAVKGHPGGRARSDVCGLRERMYNPGVDGKNVRIFALTDGVFLTNPGHGANRVAGQIANGAMSGFLLDFYDVLQSSCRCGRHRDEYPAAIMGYYTPAFLPVYDFFATEFTVCDHWFSAAPGPTWVNRMFLYAGTANGIISNGFHSIWKYPAYSRDMPEYLLVDALDAAGVDWHVYHSTAIPWMAFFPSFRTRKRRRHNVFGLRQFEDDCERDKLPPVAFVESNATALTRRPHRANSDDQPPSDVVRGQEFIGEVYETLRKSGRLEKTLFVVTYDEHGGFFDHVPPPTLPEYARRLDPYFTTLGVRVPAMVISPYVERGSVSHATFSHPSIAHSVLLRFCPDQEMTTRVHIAPNLGSLLTLPADSPRELPSAEKPVAAARRVRSSRRGEAVDPEAMLPEDLGDYVSSPTNWA